MTYRIALKPAAQRQIRKLPRRAQLRVIARIERLAADPYPSGVRKLKAETSLFRVRDGNYRIVYTVQEERLVVLIVRIGDRRDAYGP